jgi:kinesin family protein 2/24
VFYALSINNVVKAVERLMKKREERRQRQAELKEEKEVLMSMDPGNPNWEFLAMIRCVSLGNNTAGIPSLCTSL